MGNELRECPFCDGPAAVRMDLVAGASVQCERCGARGGLQATPNQARGAWNNRAAERAAITRCRFVEKALRELVALCRNMDAEQPGCPGAEAEEYRRVLGQAEALVEWGGPMPETTIKDEEVRRLLRELTPVGVQSETDTMLLALRLCVLLRERRGWGSPVRFGHRWDCPRTLCCCDVHELNRILEALSA